jgi:hypothetical protein
VPADDLVRDRRPGHGDRHHPSLGGVHGLPDRLRDLVRLAGGEPDLPLPVANRDEGVEGEPASALHDLGDAVDGDDVLDEVALLATPVAAAASTAITAAATTLAAGATPATLAASRPTATAATGPAATATTATAAATPAATSATAPTPATAAAAAATTTAAGTARATRTATATTLFGAAGLAAAACSFRLFDH